MARVVMEPGWEDHLDRAAHDFLVDISGDVLRNMRVNCPVDTGALLADLDSEVNGLKARVGAKSVEHAIFVEEGTAPHVIEPNSAEALYWPGAQHPVARVNHPGTPATHFMRNALFQERR